MVSFEIHHNEASIKMELDLKDIVERYIVSAINNLPLMVSLYPGCIKILSPVVSLLTEEIVVL